MRIASSYLGLRSSAERLLWLDHGTRRDRRLRTVVQL